VVYWKKIRKDAIELPNVTYLIVLTKEHDHQFVSVVLQGDNLVVGRVLVNAREMIHQRSVSDRLAIAKSNAKQ